MATSAAPAKNSGPKPTGEEWWGVQYYCKRCQQTRWFRAGATGYDDIWTHSATCSNGHSLSRPADLRKVCICTGNADGEKTIKLTTLPEGCNKDVI